MSLVINSNEFKGGAGQPSNQMLMRYLDFDKVLFQPKSASLSCGNGTLSTEIAGSIGGTNVNVLTYLLDSKMRYTGTPNTASDVGGESIVSIQSASTLPRPASVNTTETYSFWGRIGDLDHPFSQENVVGGDMTRLLKFAPGITSGGNTRPIMRNPTLSVTIEPQLLHSDGTLTKIFSKTYSHTRSGDKDSTNWFDFHQIVISEMGLATKTASIGDVLVVDIKGDLSFTKYNGYTTAYASYVKMGINFGYMGSVDPNKQPRPIQLGINL